MRHLIKLIYEDWLQTERIFEPFPKEGLDPESWQFVFYPREVGFFLKRLKSSGRFRFFVRLLGDNNEEHFDSLRELGNGDWNFVKAGETFGSYNVYDLDFFKNKVCSDNAIRLCITIETIEE